MRTRTWLIAVCLSVASLVFYPAVADATGSKPPMPKKYDQVISAVAQEYKIEARFIHAVIQAESDYNRFAVSAKGAQGLMQLMPATAAAYGVKNVFDPAENIRGGVQFLKVLLNLYNDDKRKTLAAYNAGQEAVKRYGGIPPYAETRTYIERVLASYQVSAPNPKTKIFEYRNAEGRLVATNDPRLAAGLGSNSPD